MKVFKEAYSRYIKSSKDKPDIKTFLKDTYAGIEELEELRKYLDNSIIESVIVNSEGVFIVLNEHFFHIKIKFNKDDWEQLPIDVLCLGNYEPNEFSIVKGMLDLFDTEKEFTFLDVGANLGWYSLFISKMFKNSRVYAFEPASVTYERLNMNIKANEGADTHIHTFNMGLYNENCEQPFYYDSYGSGASSLKNIRDKNDITAEKVKLMKMDDWASEQGVTGVDFIKFDIEGAELFAIRGALETITRDKPVIFCEILRKWSAKFGYAPNDIISFLHKLGYNCYALGKYCPGIRVCECIDESTEETNFFFLHNTKHLKIIEGLMNHEVWVHFH